MPAADSTLLPLGCLDPTNSIRLPARDTGGRPVGQIDGRTDSRVLLVLLFLLPLLPRKSQSREKRPEKLGEKERTGAIDRPIDPTKSNHPTYRAVRSFLSTDRRHKEVNRLSRQRLLFPIDAGRESAHTFPAGSDSPIPHRRGNELGLLHPRARGRFYRPDFSAQRVLWPLRRL